MRLAQRLLLISGVLGATLCGAEDIAVRPQSDAVVQSDQPVYYWKAEPVAGTAQLLTLFCSDCGPISSSATVESATHDIPLVAVLRDTLGDYQSDNDRLMDVWLLDYANPGLGKKLLSAVPFFYWHPGDGSKSAGAENPKPLLDLTGPQHPVLSEVGRNLIQWTTLDPMMMPVRATSRAYRANGLDEERLHLESAVAYLRSAPVADDGSALTKGELDTVIARLELRKKLLGGLVSEKNAAKVGEESGFEEERIRSRNWELLRQIAERTGLVFEPLNIAGQDGEYAMLWFPVGQPAPVTGTNLKPIWKLLNISDPWADTRLLNDHERIQYVRTLDANGSLLPMGEAGARHETLVPLGIYSLMYPKLPLLLVDFRDQVHVRRHEMTQRTINEVTAGVIGISHFTNWYYYVAADMYDFVSGRHGAAMDQSERLDAYSRLRVSLMLDRQLDPALRKTIRARLDDISVNPLQAGASREIRNAQVRYTRLEEESGAGGRLATLLDQQRRAEIAEFGTSNGHRDVDLVLHTATLGMYHDRAPRSPDNLAKLDVYRRVDYQLNFLDSLD
ncbi:MAG: hypothetical protein JO051_05285, partial [Acidobacteriaceae bacterium]|nr:hypothetical protein [Acidobacteriaceae bacterium]